MMDSAIDNKMVPTKKTMLNYFEKLPSKTSIVEENARKLAPIFNKQHVEEFQTRIEQFDVELSSNKSGSDYIESIKTSQHSPFRAHKKNRGPLRARLFQFHQDIRPPYFGTWQKKSSFITGRKPFGLDNEIFDYENDSEAEWDIGGPGESLKGDDSEDDEELDDYEIDMKTFVPHGYVSDDEVENNSENEENPSANRSMEEDCDIQNTDSNSDIKIIAEVKIPQPVKQTPKLDIKPIILGLTYENCPTISEAKQQFLQSFRGVSCAQL